MALTPDQWLNRLSVQMDNRSTRLLTLRSYMNGDAPLPEGAENVRDAYKTFQRKARTNFGKLVVDSLTERMIPSGFSVGEESEDSDAIRSIWKRNQLQTQIADVFRDMVGSSVGYLMVSEDPDSAGSAIVTGERPNFIITEQSPTRPDQVRAALKVYRDHVEEQDVAFMHLVGSVYKYTRALKEFDGAKTPLASVHGGWILDSVEDTGLSYIPVFPFFNPDGLGEFEPHTDILDRINWNTLQRLVITAMQAYKQRAIKGSLPEEDDEGNEIDYGAMFKPGAGSLWQLPDGVEIWESSQTDISAILAASKDDIRDLAAVTRTPMSTLMPEGSNQSAEGATFAREGLVFKANERTTRAGAVLERAMGAALGIEQGLDYVVEDIEVDWLPVERQSLSERADAATKAQDLSLRTRLRDIWQYSDERVDEIMQERALEAADGLTSMPTSGEKVSITGVLPSEPNAMNVAPAITGN